MTIAKFKAKAVILVPITPAEAPNGSLFLDSTDGNTMKTKNTGGGIQSVTSATQNLFIKSMQIASVIGLNKPVAKQPDGTIVAADADSLGGQDFIGYATEAGVTPGQYINVLTIGANLVNALVGMGFATGDEIYLSQDGNGYTNDPNSFTDDNDSIIKVGIADCAAGTASGTAVDLIVFAEVISRPI